MDGRLKHLPRGSAAARLCDTVVDPRERVNPCLVATMLTELQAWQKSVGRRLAGLDFYGQGDLIPIKPGWRLPQGFLVVVRSFDP